MRKYYKKLVETLKGPIRRWCLDPAQTTERGSGLVAAARSWSDDDGIMNGPDTSPRLAKTLLPCGGNGFREEGMRTCRAYGIRAVLPTLPRIIVVAMCRSTTWVLACAAVADRREGTVTDDARRAEPERGQEANREGRWKVGIANYPFCSSLPLPSTLFYLCGRDTTGTASSATLQVSSFRCV